MCWGRKALIVSATVLALAATATSESSTWSRDRAFLVVQDRDASASILHTLDLVTGEGTPVGAIGFHVTSLAFSRTGVLFGIDPDEDLLVRIDPAQGVGVSVGRLGIDVVDHPAPDLTCDRDGNLWMMAAAGNLRGLYQIDPHTGDASWITAVDALHTRGRWPPLVSASTLQTTAWGPSTGLPAL